MSLEQQPLKNDTQPIADMPPYPRAKSDTVIPPKEHRDAPRFSLAQRIGAGAAIAVFGAGAALGLNKLGNDSPSPENGPTTKPTDSAPITPGEPSEPSPEVESPMDKYGIKAADHPTFESAVTAYIDRLNEYNSSASHTYDQPGDPKYLEALFGADWQANPELAEYVSWQESSSTTISTNHFGTGENGDTEYEHNMEVTEVAEVEETPDQVAGIVSVHSTDNVMDTALAGFASTGENLDSIAQFHYTFTNVDGHWQVTEVDNLGNNS